MSNKNLLITIGAIIIIAVVIGVIYWSSQKSGTVPGDMTDEGQAIDDLGKRLEETVAGLDVPVTNPLDEAVPDVNPLEAANPFKVKNPFE